MTDREDSIQDIFTEMIAEGRLSTSNQWIADAIDQKNPKLTMDLACSRLLIYDAAEKMLLSITDLN